MQKFSSSNPDEQYNYILNDFIKDQLKKRRYNEKHGFI